MSEIPKVPAFRALILEDHDFQREIGAELLRRCGAAEVFEAADGASALDLVRLRDTKIDVLLCDLNMPGMDGLAFLRHFAEARSESSVILASALDASIVRAAEIMAKSYGIRIIGVTEKPLSSEQLLPLLLRHFSRSAGNARTPLNHIPIEEIAAGIDRRQFEPYFQPKLDVRNATLVGAEALIRWRHPERGLVPPAAFIPAMEKTGLITQVTFILVAEVLAQCRRWLDLGLNVPVSINISVESLSDTGLADALEQQVIEAGVDPGALTIEITETVAMTDLGHALETLARCRMKGFSLSIDDYGTGFSSMQQLTRLPLSELKIDRSFVTGAAQNPLLEALIETSVAMAGRLKLKTVAEGVETADDWYTVAKLGCGIAQGYFMAKPMPGDQIIPWYEGWRAGSKNLRPPEARRVLG